MLWFGARRRIFYMGQFPVPASRTLRPLFTFAIIAIGCLSSFGALQGVKADTSVTQASAGPKVDLDILNANLLSVVRALRLQSGAQIVVEGGDKAYNSVSLTVSGSLSTVLNYVAMSAGAVVTRNSDGVYVLSPQGASVTTASDSPSVPASTQDAAVVGPTQDARPEEAVGPMHWERVRLQYVSPSFVLMELNDPSGQRATTTQTPAELAAQDAFNNPHFNGPGGFSVSPENLNEQPVAPGIPNGQNVTGGYGATLANEYTTNQSSQAEQFAPGGGGFGGAGGFGGGGAAGGLGGAQAGASLRPDGINSIIADMQDNSLLVRGDTQGIQELRQIIQLLDIPAKQVQIKAEFITASVTTVDSFGINFQLVPAPNLTGSFTGNTQTGSTTVEFAEGNLVAEMQATLSKDATNVVSAPLVTATNNTPATFSVTENIPYNTSSTSVSGSGTATTSSSVGSLEVQSGLQVTPQINGDNSVTLRLSLPETSTTPSGGDLPPTVTTQSITTLRTVANGETMVLGGLVSKDEDNARVEVPFLGEIPIIGSLFRTKNTNVADSELLIFITPTVLPYPGQTTSPPPAVDTNAGGVTP
jgi:hypothetical protein